MVAQILHPLGYGVNSVLEVVFILAQLAVVMAFLVVVAYSKHLHIVLAPLNVMFSRRPNALGPLEPMRSGGKVLDFEEADPDTDVFGIGKVEDLTWKGMLDLGTCTECGRCQSQCPAWVTGKPLSPKQLILDLRDHAFAKAPYLLADRGGAGQACPDAVKAEAERPLVGDGGRERRHRPRRDLVVHELRRVREGVPGRHRAHRPHQRDAPPPGPDRVRLPAGGDHDAEQPGAHAATRGAWPRTSALEWITELDFEVPVLDGTIPDDIEYLFWVGCAGALEDRAKKATKAIAELLHVAGVKFAVLGPAEACTGDPARRLGNEFVFHMLAQQNIETLNDAGVAKGTGKKVIASCPHCFNTISREYPQLGGELRGHPPHPAARPPGRRGQADPGQPGRGEDHLPRPVLPRPAQQGLHPAPGDHRRRARHQAEEMHRCKGKGFCCGAGGARMWLEERTGKRINDERIDEALALDPDTISTACPYCMVMLGDAVNAKKAAGEAKQTLEVIDVAQLLVRAVKLREGAAQATARESSQRGPRDLPGPARPAPRPSPSSGARAVRRRGIRAGQVRGSRRGGRGIGRRSRTVRPGTGGPGRRTARRPASATSGPLRRSPRAAMRRPGAAGRRTRRCRCRRHAGPSRPTRRRGRDPAR